VGAGGWIPRHARPKTATLRRVGVRGRRTVRLENQLRRSSVLLAEICLHTGHHPCRKATASVYRSPMGPQPGRRTSRLGYDESPRFAGLFDKRLKGFEPTTFCMASSCCGLLLSRFIAASQAFASWLVGSDSPSFPAKSREFVDRMWTRNARGVARDEVVGRPRGNPRARPNEQALLLCSESRSGKEAARPTPLPPSQARRRSELSATDVGVQRRTARS